MTAGRKTSPMVFIGFSMALVSAIAAVLAGFGSRWGWWHFRTGFEILKAAAGGGIAAAALSSVGLFSSFRTGLYRGTVIAVTGLLLGLVTAGVLLTWMVRVKTLPMIHDITTDTQSPPEFIAVLPLRKDTPNPSRYGGPEVAAQQIKAYPEVKPLELKLPVSAAFDRALETARRMGWKIVAANRAEGRIEATDITFWFGFKDDIVVRITGEGSGSRIDLRSVSRVGKSDVGTNAKRIDQFLKRMKE